MSQKKPPRKKTVRTAAKRAPVRRAPASKAQARRRPRTAATAVKKVRTKTKMKAAAPAKAKTGKRRAVKRAPGKFLLKIPPILLEGDTTPAPTVRGPGQRYALGPASPAEHFEPTEELGELPEAYGTGRLFLTARDLHWLYAHWDLTRDQQKKYNALSADGHLVVRVYTGSVAGELATQVHVHPESRHWFVHAGRAGTRYVAELGYNRRKGKWVTVAVSGAATTPSEAPATLLEAAMTPPEVTAANDSVQFATIPAEVPLARLAKMVRELVSGDVPLVEALQQVSAAGHPDLPKVAAFAAKEWTPEQARNLTEAVSLDQVRQVRTGSLEITELVRRHLVAELASQAAAKIPSPVSAVGSISSPFGGEPQPKDFWFDVNAELIIYGATEPNAKVTIGGRPIKLRPDGTFSYRFALPDGSYRLPVVAISAAGEDVRAADLQFARATQSRGDAGAHPQDPALKSPQPEHA